MPPITPESTALSKELKRRGFRFVGPTTVYAAMQACGIVNDHIARCWVRAESVQQDDEASLALLPALIGWLRTFADAQRN